MIDCPDDPLPPAKTLSNAPGWALLGLLVALVLVEGLLVATGHETISEWLWRRQKGSWGWKIATIIVVGGAIWHLVKWH